MNRLVSWLEKRLNLAEFVSLLSAFGLLYTEVDTRKPVREALRESIGRPVPAYARWPRVLGLVTVVLFIFQIVTGSLLAFYYQPSPETAYISTRTILRDVSFGWFVHQFHRWAAQLLLIVLLLRLVRFFYRGLYRAPRELLWISTAALFVVGANMELTGRLLTWDALSYWSTVRALEIVFDLPVLGGILAFLLGGHDIIAPTLVRFYFLHVVLLPLFFIFFLYLGFSTIRRVGLSPEVSAHKEQAKASFRAHLYNLAILVTLMFAVIVTLAVLMPLPFQAEADPFSTPAGVRPPWYFLAAYGFLEMFPAFVPRWLSASLLLLVLALFVMLPFLGRETDRERPSRYGATVAVGSLMFLAWAACTVYGFLLDLPPGGGG
ncbi:MAG: cytochrome b N-terminal domain-containing protein [Acidobacteriota bacterium]